MTVENRGFRLKDFCLDYIPGNEEQPGDIEVSNLTFITEGPSQVLSLTHLPTNHWIASDNPSILLPAQTENVVLVLQGKELDDIASVILSREDLQEASANDEEVASGFPRRVQMEDLSLYTESGRWFLSWQTEAVVSTSRPTSLQSGTSFETGIDLHGSLDLVEVAVPALFQPDFENRIDEEMLYLTGINVLYAADEGTEAATTDVEVAKMVIFAKDHIWALHVSGSSPNRWGVEANVNVAIPRDTESLTVSLQDNGLDDVAFAFISLPGQDIVDGQKACEPSPGHASRFELDSVSHSGGTWSVEWNVGPVDASTRRDNDLVSRWKKLEALFPWETGRESPSFQLHGAVTEFLDQDAVAYGSDILLRQAYAVLQMNKCKITGDIHAIEQAIELQTLLVVDARVQQCRQMHAIATSHLGAMHHERFNKSMVLEDLNQGISLLQAAIEHTSSKGDIHAECLHRLAQAYHTRFQSTSNVDDSVNAITALSEACNMSHHILESNIFPLLSWLYKYAERGDRTAIPLEKAIGCLRQLVESKFPPDPAHPLFRPIAGLSTLLGVFLKGLCVEPRIVEKLNHAIHHYRFHLSLLKHFPGIPGYSDVLIELSSLLKDRFLHSEELPDLDEAIRIANEALAATPSDNTGTGLLASLYFRRYEELHVPSDLDASIALQQQNLKSMSSDHPSYSDAVDDLAKYLCTRSVAFSTESDNEEALSVASNALALSQEDADRDVYKRFQAFVLHQKYLLTRNLDHLHSAAEILLHLDYTSSSAELKSKAGDLLYDLSDSYSSLYSTSHNAEYLHKAVACSRKCVAISDSPEAYSTLAKSLHGRYSINESTHGLEATIEAKSTSLRMVEERGDQPSPGLLLDLGNLIGKAASMSGDVVRYALAKEFIQRAVLDSEGRKDLHSKALVDLIQHTAFEWVLNLQSAIRNSANGQDAELAKKDPRVVSEIHSSLAIMEELLLRVPRDSPDYPRAHEVVLMMRITSADADSDSQRMNEVVQHIWSVRQTDPTYGNYPLFLAYKSSRHPLYRDLAIKGFRAAALDQSRETLERFRMARYWLEVHKVDGGVQPDCLEAYDTAVGLLSMVVGLGQRISERHSQVTDHPVHPRELQEESGGAWSSQQWAARLPVEAAAKAIQFQSTEKALEWLEQGRCLVWNQLQTLRTPLDDLEKHAPLLAQRFRDVSRYLEEDEAKAVSLERGDPDIDARIALEEASASRVRASKEWEVLLHEARQIPGFEDFLRPTRCSSLLQNLPESGPVVVLNAHESRCDAIVLSSGMDEPMVVPLSKMTYARAKAMQHRLMADLRSGGLRMRGELRQEFREELLVEDEGNDDSERGSRPATCRPAIERMLRDLWESVVKPILDALAFNEKSIRPNTRIWWCPTGPLSFLPIHAAGIYGWGAISECLADYAVSSYIPSVSALTARVRQGKKGRAASDARILLVSVPEAKGQIPIHGTTREVQALRNFATSNTLNHFPLEGEEATAERVMEEISNSTIVHLACHGSQNSTDPMQSGFFLQDKRLDLSTIIKANLNNADLAFLSACQTGTGDEKLSNEAVHLAAGMLAAGFRGTVATMWAIKDAYAPKLSEDFYKELVERGREKGRRVDGEDAAYALHYAIQELKKVPMNKMGGAEKWFLTWVPYVHYGF